MQLEELRTKRIVISGGTGFLGQHLTRALISAGCHDVVDLGSGAELDLDCYGIVHHKPQVLFHLAGYNGGIAFNKEHQYDIFTKNTLMALNVVEAAKRVCVDKLISVVASCAYPSCTTEDVTTWAKTYQEQLCNGIMDESQFNAPTFAPHESVEGHGYAKRNLQLATKFANQQYGLNAICVCPTTLFGPGDSFDPKRTKVVGGMIQRFVKAKQEKVDEVVCWGTGSPMREFLYVKDAAKLLIESALKYDDSTKPLNLCGWEINIGTLAMIVAEAVGYTGEIKWTNDRSQDGQWRKRLTTTMETLFPEFKRSHFETAMRETVKWYTGSED